MKNIKNKINNIGIVTKENHDQLEIVTKMYMQICATQNIKFDAHLHMQLHYALRSIAENNVIITQLVCDMREEIDNNYKEIKSSVYIKYLDDYIHPDNARKDFKNCYCDIDDCLNELTSDELVFSHKEYEYVWIKMNGNVINIPIESNGYLITEFMENLYNYFKEHTSINNIEFQMGEYIFTLKRDECSYSDFYDMIFKHISAISKNDWNGKK